MNSVLKDNNGNILDPKIPRYEKLKEIVLFEGKTGIDGVATLNDSAENYKRIKIFYYNNDNLCSDVTVDNPNNKIALLNSMYPNSQHGIYLKATRATINANTISMQGGSQLYATPSGNTVQSGTFIYIYKVIGYK